MFRASTRLPFDFGPPRIKPTLAGADYVPPKDERFFWYVFSGANLRAVAHDIFLDGNSYRASHHVDSVPLIGEASLGLATFFGPVRITYTYTYRTREYEQQHGPDRFGGISASFRL